MANLREFLKSSGIGKVISDSMTSKVRKSLTDIEGDSTITGVEGFFDTMTGQYRYTFTVEGMNDSFFYAPTSLNKIINSCKKNGFDVGDFVGINMNLKKEDLPDGKSYWRVKLY